MSDFSANIVETLLEIVIVLLIFSALAGFGTYLERKIRTKLCRTLWLIASASRWH